MRATNKTNDEAWVIGRPIQGISLNGLEHLYSDGFIATFDSEEEARIYLHLKGYTDEDIEKEGIIIHKLKGGDTD